MLTTVDPLSVKFGPKGATEAHGHPHRLILTHYLSHIDGLLSHRKEQLMQDSLVPPTLDARVQVAWQEQVAAAAKTPGLLPELMRGQPELLSRFVAHYTQLRALPRRVRRALQRQWRLPLAGIALMLALGQPSAQAATITVNNSCTLVDAITAANADTATG